LAVAADGTVYVADTANKCIIEIACDGSTAPFGCLDESVLKAPTAVVVGPHDRLYIADVSQVVVVDRRTGTIVDVWHSIAAPVDLAVDSLDQIYVADAAGNRIVRMRDDGDVDATFDVAVASPRAVAIALIAGVELVLALSASGPLAAFDLDGTPNAAAAATFASIELADAHSLAAASGTLYVASPAGVLAWDESGALLGVVDAGTSSALSLDCRGRLHIAGADGVQVFAGVGRARRGRVLLGPLPLVDGIPRWDRLVIERLDPINDAAHLRTWTRTSVSALAPPLPPEAPALGELRERTAADDWRAAPLDTPDCLILNEAAPYLWICLDFSGDGTASPSVRSVRVDHLGLGLFGRLPAVYAASDETETGFRLVQLLAAPLDQVGSTIDDLPRTFSAEAADTNTLGAVGRWLAQGLDDRESEQAQRRTLAEAFSRHGKRGTRAELERTLSEAAGATVRISEPAQEVALWSLGTARLGSQTMLIPAAAYGAVLGSSEIDRSHLITDEDAGWPLNADVAHRFCVHVLGAQLAEADERRLRAVLQTEKPAHTLAEICVGAAQSRVGISTVGEQMIVGSTYEHETSATTPVVGGRVGAIGLGGRQ
jgi:phage tail-like protein